MELTIEQKEALEKIAKVVNDTAIKISKDINTLYKWIRRVIAKVKELLIMSWKYIKSHIMELPPKQRYKLLKSMGIKNYLPFFRRNGVIHCRNNC